MPLVPPELLLLCHAGELVELCSGPLREHLGSSNLPSHSNNRIPADFYSQILWGLFFSALMLKVKEPSVGLDAFTFLGTSVGVVSLLILNCHM